MNAKMKPVRRAGRGILARLRSERGASDPILTVASIAVSGIVSAAVIGSMILIINLGTNYVAEQSMTTSAGQAQTAFAEDAQNASAVAFSGPSGKVGNQSVVFQEEPSKSSAVSTPRGRPYTCRVSEWRVTGSVLENRVNFSTSAAAAPCAGLTAKGAPLFTVPLKESSPGVAAAAAFTSKNAAGQPLTFNSGGVLVASPSTVDSAYWTAAEWTSAIPKTVAFSGDTELPVSGARTVELSGRTWLATGDLGLPAPWKPEDNPEATTFTVKPVTNVKFTTGTTGVTWGGINESTVITWDKTTCGAYPVIYNVSWKSLSAGAPSFNQNVGPSYNASDSIELAPVPNGAIANVKITASCPPTIPDVEGVYQTLGHETPIPTPVITGIAQPQPNVHAVSWLPISSLPTLYMVNGREVTTPIAGWANPTPTAQIKSATPVSTVTQNVTWPATTTYGRSYEYRVMGNMLAGGTGSLWSNPMTTFVPVPSPTTPAVITPTPAALTSYQRVSAGCVPGTSAEYRSQQSLNDKPMGAFSGWSTTQVVATGALEGYKVSVVVETRCAANGVPSPSTLISKKTWITNVFAPAGGLRVTIPAQARNFSTSTVVCGPGTVSTLYRWQGFTVDGVNTAGPTNTWSNSSIANQAFAAGEGRTVVITADSICRGLYADSAPTVGSAREVYTIFASLTPRAFANFPSDFWFDAIGSCPAGLTMQSAATWSVGSGRTGIVNWGGPGGRSSGTNISNGNNTSYTAWGRCLSTYSGTFGPENKASYYYGSTPSAPSVWVSRYSNQVGQWFTVYISSNACTSNGMRTDFHLAGRSWRTSGTSASFGDYWNSPGGRTYTGYIRCVDAASNAGNASASRSASVSIYVPAPSNPTWVSVSGGSRSSIPGGGLGINYVTYSAGGSSYASGYVTQGNIRRTNGLWAGFSANVSCVGPANAVQGRAYASGSGGTSGWSYSSVQGVGAVRYSNVGGCW